MAVPAKPTAHVPVGGLTVVDRTRAALGGVASARVWRGVLAAAVGLLVYWTTAGGVILYWPGAQVAAVVGLAVALVAPGFLAAAAIAASVCAVGAFTGPVNFWLVGSAAVAPQALLPWALLSAVVAAAAGYAIVRRWVRPNWVLWLVVAVVLVNMWVTVISSNRLSFQESRTGLTIPALAEMIDGADVPPAMKRADDYFYLIVDGKLRAGEGYYSAAAGSFDEVGDGSITGPAGVLNLRQPALYVFLASLPNATWVFSAFLMLVSLAAVSVLWLLGDVVRAPLALPAVFAVAAYTVPFSTSLLIYYTELWIGPMAVLVFACFAISLRAERWRAWVAGAVAIAVAAFLVRELAGVVLVAGTVAAMIGSAKRRRWSLAAWGVGWLVAAAGYAAHVVALRPFLTGATGQGVWGRGGIDFMLNGFVYNTLVFGVVIGSVLAVLGYAGAVCLPDLGRHVFALIVLLVPPVAFLLAGNGARDMLTNSPINYWSASFMPIAYACIPAGLAVIPGAVPLGRLSGPAAS